MDPPLSPNFSLLLLTSPYNILKDSLSSLGIFEPEMSVIDGQIIVTEPEVGRVQP